jgi:hypothetical protein
MLSVLPHACTASCSVEYLFLILLEDSPANHLFFSSPIPAVLPSAVVLFFSIARATRLRLTVVGNVSEPSAELPSFGPPYSIVFNTVKPFSISQFRTRGMPCRHHFDSPTLPCPHAHLSMTFDFLKLGSRLRSRCGHQTKMICKSIYNCSGTASTFDATTLLPRVHNNSWAVPQIVK